MSDHHSPEEAALVPFRADEPDGPGSDDGGLFAEAARHTPDRIFDLFGFDGQTRAFRAAYASARRVLETAQDEGQGITRATPAFRAAVEEVKLRLEAEVSPEGLHAVADGVVVLAAGDMYCEIIDAAGGREDTSGGD